MNGDILHRRNLVHRVRVRAIRHLHQRFTFRLDAIDKPRLRELHLPSSGGFQLKKLFRFRVLGDVFRQVTPELFQFQVVDGDDIVTHAVEQTGIVRHDDARDVLQRQEVSFDPLDVHDVQVVRRFVHQQDVCVQTHRSRQRQLHSPTTG